MANIKIEDLITAEVARLSSKYGKEYLECEDIIKITGLGRDNVRNLMNNKNFPTTQIGKRKIVSIVAFVSWQMNKLGAENGNEEK